jgi:hypothetical protein
MVLSWSGRKFVCEELGNEVAAPGRWGNLNSGEGLGRGESPCLPRTARGGSPSSTRRRPAVRIVGAPGRASPTCTLCHGSITSQETRCKFFQLRLSPPLMLAIQEHSRATSWFDSRQRAFSLSLEPTA